MKKISLSIILLHVVQLAHAADGSTTSAKFMVSATIQNGCSLSNSEQTLDFGQQPAMSQSNLTTQVINSAQTWNLRCTQNLPVSVVLGGGDSFLNNQRRMKLVGQNQFVPYRLYQKSDLSAEYISGTSYALTPATASNNLINFAIYSVANLNNNNQPRAAGLYKDAVAITISW